MTRPRWIILGTIVVGVLVALVVADRVALSIADRQLAQRLRTELRTNQDPDVGIQGFPFLTQVIAGDYPDIAIHADGVAAEPLHAVDVDLDLHHARLPLNDLVARTVQRVDVDQITGEVQIGAADLGHALGVNDMHLDPAAGGMTLSGTSDVAGATTRLAVTTAVSVNGTVVSIEPQTVAVGVPALGNQMLSLSDPQLLSRFTLGLDARRLPLAVTPTRVWVQHDTLHVNATTGHVRLG